MVKKKGFGGTKVDVKDIVAPPPAAKAPSGPAWAQGAGAAAKAPALTFSTAPQPKPSGSVGAWAKGGPQGLAATAASVSAKPAFAPISRPVAAKAPVRAALGQRGKAGQAPPPDFLNDGAFPEAEKLKTADEKSQEKAQADAAAAFPESSNCNEALAALLKASGSGSQGNGQTPLETAFTWLLQCGLADANKVARTRMLQAGVLIIEGLASKGGNAAVIQRLLETYFEDLQHKGKNTPQVLEANGLVDAQLYGSLAVQLGDEHPKYGSIRMRLLRRLVKNTTPPEVQQAIADALLPLFASDETAAEEAYKGFVKDIVSAQEPVRRGAALGIAALVKSAGAGAMKKFAIMDLVKEAVNAEGKTAAGRRQGGLFCLDAIATVLGRSFDPYALTSLPWLLTSCSDSVRDVQLAGRDAAKTVVSQVSSNALRLMVKPLIEGLKNKQWRTQLSAIELLKPIIASMVADGNATSKRLATVLPKVVPLLCDAIAGTRAECRNAAREVLEQIGSAITHTDFAPLAPTCINALCDPAEGPVLKALDTLLSAVYTTTIDSASCSLICPVIARALARGDPGAKKKGADFVRTIVQLVGEQEELTPYLTSLWPYVQVLLGDASPPVRVSAAQAVGALCSAAVADADIDCVGWLMEQLNTAQDEVMLDGSATGLAMVISCFEEEQRTELVDQLLSKEPAAGRVGRLGVFRHLAKCMIGVPGGEETFIAALPTLGAGLSDPEEGIRTVSRDSFAATIEVASGGVAAATASHLEVALRATDVKVRIVAADLAFDLMPRLKSCPEARAELVTGAVLMQADSVPDVRRCADRVWRAATEAGVAPGKLLTQLRPRLLARIASELSSGVDATAGTAGRAAAQLEKRLETSGGMLDDLVPDIVEALNSEEPSMQRSTCVGLSEMLLTDSCHKILRNASLSAALQDSLFSDNATVRVAAARCAVVAPAGEFLEPLLDQLGAASTITTHNILGLQEIINRDTTGAALAILAAPPHSTGKVSCLAAAAGAPASVLKLHVPGIFHACVEVFGGAAAKVVTETVQKVVPRLDPDGVSAAIDVAISKIVVGQGGNRTLAAASVLTAIIDVAASPPCDLAGTLDAIVPGMFLDDMGCVGAFSRALIALSKLCSANAATTRSFMDEAVPRIRDSLQGASGQFHDFQTTSCEAMLPLLGNAFQVHGQRQCAAEAFTELLPRTKESTLQLHAVKAAGPLVRALTEKPVDVELQLNITAALEALLRGAGASLRPLVPALQTSLVKLLEVSPELDQSVARALAALAPAAPKAEALVKALCKPPVRAPQLEALAMVVEALGHRRSDDVDKEAQAALDSVAGDSALGAAAAKVAAALKR